MSNTTNFAIVPTLSNSSLLYDINAQQVEINEQGMEISQLLIPEITTVAAGKFAADGTTVKAKNISVSNTDGVVGKYTATFNNPRPDCNYQVNIQLYQDGTELDDFGAYVITTVCSELSFAYYIIESDNGGSAGTLKNLEHSITVTDFLV